MLAVSDIGFVFIGQKKINTNHIHEILCNEQRTAVGFLIRLLENRCGESPFTTFLPKTIDLNQEIDSLYRAIEEKGLDIIYSGFFSGLRAVSCAPQKNGLIGDHLSDARYHLSFSRRLATVGTAAVEYCQQPAVQARKTRTLSQVCP